jgi:hypothetical protein
MLKFDHVISRLRLMDPILVIPGIWDNIHHIRMRALEDSDCLGSAMFVFPL